MTVIMDRQLLHQLVFAWKFGTSSNAREEHEPRATLHAHAAIAKDNRAVREGRGPDDLISYCTAQCSMIIYAKYDDLKNIYLFMYSALSKVRSVEDRNLKRPPQKPIMDENGPSHK